MTSTKPQFSAICHCTPHITDISVPKQAKACLCHHHRSSIIHSVLFGGLFFGVEACCLNGYFRVFGCLADVPCQPYYPSVGSLRTTDFVCPSRDSKLFEPPIYPCPVELQVISHITRRRKLLTVVWLMGVWKLGHPMRSRRGRMTD